MNVDGLIDKEEMTRTLGSTKMVKKLLHHWLEPVIQGRGRRRTMVTRRDFHRAQLLILHGILPQALPSDGGPSRTGWPPIEAPLQNRIDHLVAEGELIRTSSPASFSPADIGQRPSEGPSIHWLLEAVAKFPFGPVPIDRLQVDPERFQWKSISRRETGTNDDDRLGGIFSPALACAITCYEVDGVSFILDGHHRYELARGTGAAWLYARRLPANVFTETDAYVIGVLLNVADGHGSIRDQVSALRRIISLGYGSADDVSAYLRNRGAPALSLYTNGCQDLIDSVANGILDPSRALAIAESAPQHPALQRTGIREAVSHPRLPARVLRVHVAQLAREASTHSQMVEDGTLWEPDDSILRQSRQLAERVDRLRRDIDRRIRAAAGAVTAPDAAMALGVHVHSVNRTRQHIDRLRLLRTQLAQWRTGKAAIYSVERELQEFDANPSTLDEKSNCLMPTSH